VPRSGFDRVSPEYKYRSCMHKETAFHCSVTRLTLLVLAFRCGVVEVAVVGFNTALLGGGWMDG
jgi:hypothetical protein